VYSFINVFVLHAKWQQHVVAHRMLYS